MIMKLILISFTILRHAPLDITVTHRQHRWYPSIILSAPGVTTVLMVRNTQISSNVLAERSTTTQELTIRLNACHVLANITVIPKVKLGILSSAVQVSHDFIFEFMIIA